MKFFKNPPGRRRKKKRRTAAQVAATKKLVALNKKKRRKTVKRKRRAAAVATPKRRRKRATQKRSTKMARRKGRTRSVARRSSARRVVRRKGRRRSSGSITLRRIKGKVYRSNPGIVRQVVSGAKDAVFVLGGGAAARTISSLLPLPANMKTGLPGAAVQLASALAVGMAARKFLGADAARMMIAGAMQAPIKAIITTIAPQVAPLLGDYAFDAYLDPMGSYPALAGGDGGAVEVFTQEDDYMGSYPDGSY